MKPKWALAFTILAYGLFVYWRVVNGEEWMHWLGWVFAGFPGAYWVWFNYVRK